MMRKKIFKEAIGLTSSLEIKMKSDLSLVYTALAKDHYNKGVLERKNKDFHAEFKSCLQVIVLAFLSLETHINNYIIDKKQKPREMEKIGSGLIKQLQTTKDDFKNAGRIGRKFLQAPFSFANKTYNIKKYPWTAFLKLKDLRNNLVHYEPWFEEPAKHPIGLSTSKIRATVSIENAKFALDTVSKMIEKLHFFDSSTMPKEFKPIDRKKVSRHLQAPKRYQP